MDNKYNANSIDSVINYALQLKGKTLREACGNSIESHGYTGKGNFGQLLENFYFGIERNSRAEPDFLKVGLELKTSPLKINRKGEYSSKERLVLGIINYLKVHNETFETSSFWKKNAHLLLVFYLHDKHKDLLDYFIKIVGSWKYPSQDLLQIKRDWELINQKIKEGKAHELSEGDTFYLGACTKGSKGGNLRKQPFSHVQAPQRAYSLKQKYVNHIIANITDSETEVYGKIIDELAKVDASMSIEEVVILKFEPFYGKSVLEIAKILGLKINNKAKNYLAKLTNKLITKSILGIEASKKIEEFEKGNIEVKTIRLRADNLPKENISFRAFNYNRIINEDWEESGFKDILERRYLFIFYQFENKQLILKKVKFWNMPYLDIIEAKEVWEKTVQIIKQGNIVKRVDKNGKRFTNFPKKSNHRISHVRPHASNKYDTYPLPIADVLTGETKYMKHCFWLNNNYVKNEIYLK